MRKTPILQRAEAVAIAIIFGGCALAGSAKDRRFPVEVVQRDDGVVIEGDKTFGHLVCLRVDLSRLRLDPHGSSLIRTVWEVDCPKGEDCMHTLRYGEPTVPARAAAEPLVHTSTGEYYSCQVRGGNGWGFASFTVDVDGNVQRAGDVHLP
jgi:hypothetical protein